MNKTDVSIKWEWPLHTQQSPQVFTLSICNVGFAISSISDAFNLWICISPGSISSYHRPFKSEGGNGANIKVILISQKNQILSSIYSIN